MKFFIRGLFLFAIVIGLLLGFFSLYAHFLMDYSLDSLTYVSSAARQNSQSDVKLSNASQNVYRAMIEDMALEEAAQDDLDMQNLVLLDLASRSLDEAQYRAGYARANVYLDQVLETKKPERSAVLLLMDRMTKSFFEAAHSVQRFFVYLSQRLFKKESAKEKVELEEYASALLLNQAQEREHQGLRKDAEERYKKFLELYPSHPERAFAAVSLGNILIKERKSAEAVKFLKKIQAEFSGRSENRLIAKLLRRAETVQAKQLLIEQLKKQMLQEKDSSARQAIFLRLGVAYMATHQMQKAEAIFSKLQGVKDPKIRQKAGFYLGWIYKAANDYDKSAGVFSQLLAESELDAELELGVRAQLADALYKKGDVKNSEAQYQAISIKADAVQNDPSAKKSGARSAWRAFSELELVNIYSFDLKDQRGVREHLDKLINLAESGVDYRALELTLKRSGKISLRDLGFQALVEKRVTRALDFFTKYLSEYPDDALTMSGLATVYVLMGDLESARTYAQKGYERQVTEYSMLMLGYVESLMGNYKGAIQRYRQVLSSNPSSTSAGFNLAYVYLMASEYQKALDIMEPLEKQMAGIPDKKFMRAKTLNNIGYCYWAMGNTAKDAEFFRKALEVSPGFDIAKKNLEELKNRTSEVKAATFLDEGGEIS